MAVLANLKAFRERDAFRLCCAVPFFQRGTGEFRELSKKRRPRLLEPYAPIFRTRWYVVELSVKPGQPFVHLRFHRIQHVEFGAHNVRYVHRDIGRNGVGFVK